jgi:ribosomal protein S19E (S16A)
LRAHIGVGTLKHIYGSNKRNGVRRRHHQAGAGKVIRWSLQRLEELGILAKDKKSSEKKWSRVITKNGQKELDVIANNIGKDIYKKAAAH